MARPKAPPDGASIAIHTLISQALRTPAKSNVNSAAAIGLALAADCMGSAADLDPPLIPDKHNASKPRVNAT